MPLINKELDPSFPEKYPLLFSVDSPADLRRLDMGALDTLAGELRNYIIDVVSVKQGHLGSNLGVIELTIALHYVFDTPYEPLIWDVGHQSYAHKILTGRREDFLHLRELGGISGFPSRKESPYDSFGTGHSSTSVSAALGMALADAVRGDTGKSRVAVIGDASIASGMALEALNHAASTKANLLIVLNDNAIGIDPVTGSLEKHLRRLLKDNTGDNVFRALGMEYRKIPDGHNMPELINALEEMKRIPGVKLLHVPTTKGKGFPSAEAEQVLYHYPGVFDRSTGAVTGSVELRYQDILGQELLRAARADAAIYALTPAMPTSSGLALMQKEMPDRVIDTGIAEPHTVTLAAGMACSGLKPFAVVYSTFLQRSYDQIVHDVAVQNLPVRLMIDRAGVVGADGPTHHGVFDLSYLLPVPNMTVIAPANGAELRAAVRFAAHYGRGPLAVRYPRGKAAGGGEPQEEIVLGRSRRIFPAGDVTVISVGAVLPRVQQAFDTLSPKERQRVGLYDLRFVKPLDQEALKEIFSRSRIVVTVEDGVVRGGAGSTVMLWAAQNGFPGVPVKMLGVPDEFLPCATQEELYRMCGIDDIGIARTVRECLEGI